MNENFSQLRICFPLGPFVTNTESSKTLGRRELLSEKAFGICTKKNDEYISEETRHRRRISGIVEDTYDS